MGQKEYNASANAPWKPTCWVGGMMVRGSRGLTEVVNWVSCGQEELSEMDKDCRAYWAATKATAAILRAMRK